MRTLKSKVSITLDADLVKKVKILAEQDDRSFSQYINKVLKTNVEEGENVYLINESISNEKKQK